MKKKRQLVVNVVVGVATLAMILGMTGNASAALKDRGGMSGDVCSRDADCAKGYFCGEVFLPTEEGMEPVSLCSSEIPAEEEPAIMGENEPCRTLYDCAAGLECVYYGENYTKGVCERPPRDLSCSLGSDCEPGEFCNGILHRCEVKGEDEELSEVFIDTSAGRFCRSGFDCAVDEECDARTHSCVAIEDLTVEQREINGVLIDRVERLVPLKKQYRILLFFRNAPEAAPAVDEPEADTTPGEGITDPVIDDVEGIPFDFDPSLDNTADGELTSAVEDIGDGGGCTLAGGAGSAPLFTLIPLLAGFALLGLRRRGK